MSKINKLITNKPVTLTEEEVTNLSKTLSAVQTAGGGGGGGGRVYYGDNSTISVNQIDGIISLTTDATKKLNTPIPTKVSDLTDYEDYQTVDKMSAYLTTAQYNSDSAKFATKTELETTAATFEGLIQSYVQGLASEAWVTAQGYLTKPSGDLYYTPLPAGLSDDQYYAMTNSGWKVIQGGGGQGGISTVAHDSSLSGNGNNENLGIKTDAALNLTNASAKSAVNAASAYHAQYFTYGNKTMSIAAYAEMTELAIDSLHADEPGYREEELDEPPLIAEYAASAYLGPNTYLGFDKFVTSGDYISGDFQYALTTAGWAKVQAGSTFTGVTTTGSISGGGVNNDTIGLLTSAENALADIDNKVDKPDTTQTDLNNNYLIYSTLTGTGTTTGWMPLSANYYSKTEADGRYQKKADMSSYLTTAQYETDSATFVTSASNTITGTKQYALTTSGWAEVQAGSTFTGVETTGAISGTGIAGSEIGLVKSATSALDLINDQYQIDGSQYITVVPNTATKKVVIGLDNQVSNAIDTVTANANIWNNASAVSAKSHTTIDNTTNIITTENQGTSASLSAVEYKDNVNVAGMNVQQIYAVRNDGDIFACLSTTANKGTLFFVCSGV